MHKISEIEVKISGRRMPLKRVQISSDQPTLTQQKFQNDQDIHTILNRFAKTGILGDPSRTPIYGDFSNPNQFIENMNMVADFKSQFEQQPVKIREKFHNDPQELIEYLSDKKNHKEAVKLGLMDSNVLPPEEPAVPPVPAPPGK